MVEYCESHGVIVDAVLAQGVFSSLRARYVIPGLRILNRDTKYGLKDEKATPCSNMFGFPNETPVDNVAKDKETVAKNTPHPAV